MKSIFLFSTIAFLSISTTAFATTTCGKKGGGYKCESGGTVYNVPTANSAAAAIAAVENHVAQAQGQGQAQDQQQGQGQGQSSENNNSNSNGGNTSTNVIEGDPANTTSFNVGVGVSVRLGEGVQARSAREAADWLAANGHKCIALDVMLNSPQVKKLGYDVNCTKP